METGTKEQRKLVYQKALDEFDSTVFFKRAGLCGLFFRSTRVNVYDKEDFERKLPEIYGLFPDSFKGDFRLWAWDRNDRESRRNALIKAIELCNE